MNSKATPFDQPYELVSIDQRDGGLCGMPSLRDSGTSEMAGRDENPFGSTAQSATKAIDFRTSNSVPPALYLSLDMCSGKEFIRFFHISVDVNPTVT